MAKTSPKPRKTVKSFKELSPELKAEYKYKNKTLNAAKKQANQAHKREMAKIRRSNKQIKTTEYYKTQRSLGRSGAVTATITGAEQQREKTRRIEAEQSTIRAQLASSALDQYSKLINGEQGSSNPVNESDNSGNPSGSWAPNDTL